MLKKVFASGVVYGIKSINNDLIEVQIDDNLHVVKTLEELKVMIKNEEDLSILHTLKCLGFVGTYDV